MISIVRVITEEGMLPRGTFLKTVANMNAQAAANKARQEQQKKVQVIRKGFQKEASAQV